MISFADFESNLQIVRKRLSEVGAENVRIIGVTKTWGPEALELCARAGIHDIGENRVQEIREKAETAERLQLNVHLIGPLQENKIKYLPRRIGSMDSLASLSLSRKLARKFAQAGEKIEVLIQLNVTGEPNKSGILVENESLIRELIEGTLTTESLHWKGFMCMGPTPKAGYDMSSKEYQSDTRRAFETAAQVFQKLTGEYKIQAPRLSMGMSQDYWLAAEVGATEVRLGSVLFGQRQPLS